MPSARYVNFREDSTRWADLRLRPDDIVITAPAKAGTTWLQTICALLIFQTADLPAPLPDLSPWPDARVTDATEVRARLAAQQHRRFLKTHTPLDGLPPDTGIRFLAAAREPLDIAVSFYHQQKNIDTGKLMRLLALPAPPPELPPLRDWLAAWIREEAEEVRDQVVSLPGVLHHITGSWRRRDRPDVLLVHYADLSADLDGQMRRIAAHLGITVREPVWPHLVRAATFTHVKQHADRFAPRGPIKSPSAFFRQGRNGAGAATLDEQDLAAYGERLRQLADPQLLQWLRR
ncbi:glycolipid sulfotransferase [Actinoplanes philippinensis]|uniref:Sulfotransferase domain-containing protein n=1 Tax=Actinoplanes philippinensis TaxID=35752 RepID=A0A1I2NA83_9ACTN|nr:sulfotransferase domain-containing protein [Actinoplanes philippinensis]GIE76315.1 glycolipid sulfotransferase [Actinoplanes philippinensis]SFF98416.1 Sulfotransferase domain-containing protein [Actinoplanes philippinensis]